jgi:hypothetical protein
VLYIDNIPWHLGHKAVDNIAKKLGYHKPVHAVVIDAGSTGSRVLAFTFHESYIGGHLVLDKELFKYTKPGLSSFVDNPEKVVASGSKCFVQLVVSGRPNYCKSFGRGQERNSERLLEQDSLDSQGHSWVETLATRKG